MVNRRPGKEKQSVKQELDSVYILKLILYMVLGTQWLRITTSSMEVPIPYGLIIGLLFASHDHFKIDRKIEYALLLATTFIAFWLPIGIEIVVN